MTKPTRDKSAVTDGVHARNQLWTPALDARLRALVNEGKGDVEIGRILERTPTAVASRRNNLKLRLKRDAVTANAWRRWTDEQDQEFVALLVAGLPDEEIAKRLGRSVTTLKWRREHLGLVLTAEAIAARLRAARSEEKEERKRVSAAEVQCTKHFVDLLREYGGGWVRNVPGQASREGPAIDAYRAANERPPTIESPLIPPPWTR